MPADSGDNYELTNLGDSISRDLSNTTEFGDYAPIIVENSDTPVISFSNLTVEHLPTTTALKDLALRHFSSKGSSLHEGGKVILNNISGVITSGLWGILGPSGSGKVSLYIHSSYNSPHI